MSLDKAIEYGKEHRKEYQGGKAIDKSCRNHGGCVWCENNRRHKYLKKIQETISDIEEEETEIDVDC